MAKKAKFIVGLLGAIAVSLSTVVAPDSTLGKVVTIVLALATAVGVYLTPNAPEEPAQP